MPTFISRLCAQCGQPFQARMDMVRKGYGRFCGHRCHGLSKQKPIEQILDENTEKADGCWLWVGNIKDGYGELRVRRFGDDGRKRARFIRAHRAWWERVNGPIPDGLVVCHRCDNPPCVNPAHLFLGTNKDNSQDMARKGRSLQGEKHHKAKIATADVLEIRRLAAAGVTGRSLAARFNVTPSAISCLLTGKSWRHVA